MKQWKECGYCLGKESPAVSAFPVNTLFSTKQGHYEEINKEGIFVNYTMTSEQMQAFTVHLRMEERSEGTIQKYVSAVAALYDFLPDGKIVTKEQLLRRVSKRRENSEQEKEGLKKRKMPLQAFEFPEYVILSYCSFSL